MAEFSVAPEATRVNAIDRLPDLRFFRFRINPVSLPAFRPRMRPGIASQIGIQKRPVP